MNSRSELLHYVMQTDLVDIWEETRLDKKLCPGTSPKHAVFKNNFGKSY